MANRHKVQARARGGGVEPHLPPVKEESEGIVKEESRRGHKAGGRIERKLGGAIGGAKAAARADRPGRKRGGAVGADKSPLSSAAHASAQKLAQQH